MINMEELVEFAQKEMDRRFANRSGWCTDDWQWNDYCFQFVTQRWTVKPNSVDVKVFGPYRFIYDADEEFCGTAKEQVIKWLDSEVIWLDSEVM